MSNPNRRGTDRVAARLRYLTLRWANKLKANPRIKIHTGLDQVYGVACVGITDIPAVKINAFMWDKYRIVTTPITRPEGSAYWPDMTCKFPSSAHTVSARRFAIRSTTGMAFGFSVPLTI